jgi:phosphoenolpyruvate carboxykinase (GTP)
MFHRVKDSNKDLPVNFLGNMPDFNDLDWSGSHFQESDFKAVMNVCGKSWLKEAQSHKAFFQQFGERLPSEFMGLQEKLEMAASQEMVPGPISTHDA